jgi:hypothetical protein
MHEVHVSTHKELYLTCNDTKETQNFQNQMVASCRLLPLEHHRETRSEHPTGEDSSHEKLQEIEPTEW